MATFSTNQARQLYVAEALKPSNVISTDTVGTIAVKSDTAKNHLYFEYMGAGGMLRSDLIDIKNIMYAKATDADDLAHELAKYKVTLDPNVNGESPVAGQDYILRIAFRNYIGMSEEDQYFKYGMVHAVSGMTAGSFYQELYKSLKKNFSRETEQLLDFSLEGTAAKATMTANGHITVTAVENGVIGNSIKFAIESITAANAGFKVTQEDGFTVIRASLTDAKKSIKDLKELVAANPGIAAMISISTTSADDTSVQLETAPVALTSGDASGLIVEEVPQEWILGTFPQVPVNFTLMPDTIVVNGDDRIWGLVEKQASTNSIPDGHKIADLEYFCMGERGDVYRMMGFPNVIRTKYLVNPDLKYNTIDIHYAYVGSNEAVQKSEKDITIVVPKVGENNQASNKLTNNIILAINAATGLAITTLDASAQDY
jgi:hypothetical protein